MKQLIDAKREEVIRALSGRGQYRLQPQYSHLGVELTWQRMRPDQRKKIICKFDEAALCLPVRSVNNPKSTVESSSLCCASQDVPSSHSKQSQSSPCEHQVSGASSSYLPPPSKLSIGADESSLNLHKQVLNGIWEKVEKLINMERGLQRAASSDSSAWSVQSFSSHFVTSKESGQFMCDPQCPQWESLKICSHTVAVAEKMGRLSPFFTLVYCSKSAGKRHLCGDVEYAKGERSERWCPQKEAC